MAIRNEQSYEEFLSTLSRQELETLIIDLTDDLTKAEEEKSAMYSILEANGLDVLFVDDEELPTQQNSFLGSALAFGGKKLQERSARRKYAKAAGKQAIAAAELAKYKGKW